MKKTLLILAVLAIAASAYAIDASKGTEQGDKALLFNAAFVNAGLYNGGFGLKYYLSPGLALRPVVTFGLTSETTKQDPDSSGLANNRKHTTYDDAKASTNSFGLELAIEKTLVSNGAVNINAGIGGGFGISSYSSDSGYRNTYTNNGVAIDYTEIYTTKTERSTTSFGGGILLGAEWFITEAISLGAEYQLSVSMSSEGKDESISTYSETTGGVVTSVTTTTNNPLTSTMDFGFQTIGLTLGIRF
ncbi:outer membrane beta-barrel protein [candidate division TA06 bacterium]|uniref:Outer membrane beta-barrel protein n=1 Tax=candidate division TA06 bacterium TaxID=2250710 RepID=A0A933ICW4_UNCT6|nr:outer membrane beta-barrel protein [candidate division TA06 bacterium]